MRHLLAAGAVIALAFPTASVAGGRDVSDGTLSVRDGRGVFIVSGKGGVIGSFKSGKVVVTDPIDGDGTGAIVSGVDWRRDRTDTTSVYGGTKVRFRMIGGTFRIKVVGVGVNLSVVGRGTVTMTGAGTLDDGDYSVNGDPYTPVPAFTLQFPLSASSP
jgi:hypothetical protein